MHKLFAALFLTLGFASFAMPVSALEGTHVLLQMITDPSHQIVVGLGPEYVEQYTGRTPEEGFADIKKSFSTDQVICIATKNDAGMHFLVGHYEKTTPEMYIFIPTVGEAAVMRFTTDEEWWTAMSASDGPKGIIATLPNGIMEKNATDAAVLDLLKEAREYLGNLNYLE